VAFLRAAGQPLEVALWDRAWAAPIKWAEGHFLRPVRFGDRLSTAIVRAHIEGSELWLGFRSMLADATPVAVGTTQAIFVDLATFRRMDPPASLVALFNGTFDESSG
jgi:acyl-CoA thioesterase FadM